MNQTIVLEPVITVETRDGRRVTLLKNKGLALQIKRNRQAREWLGEKAHDVLMIECLLDGQLAMIEQSFLRVRSFQPRTQQEVTAIRTAEQLVTNGIQFRTVDPKFMWKHLIHADELLWLTWTGNLTSQTPKSDALLDREMGTFEGYPVREILASGFTFNSRRLDVYNRYVAQLATKYNSKLVKEK